MTLYPVFLLVAATTVLSPGPGVVMTLTNSLRYGFRGTLGGILGIAAGALAVAALSATGLGVLLATSAMAFTILKYAGAAYLPARAFGGQFALLVVTYSMLVILIHCGYALTAQRARQWLVSERGGRAVNRLGGAAFVCFGAALATSRR